MKEKKFDSESEIKFYNFLLENGIPEDSIIVHPNVNGKNLFRPDVAIINPTTKEYIAIFEVKGHYSAPIERGICQVYRYLNELGNNAVRAFLTIQNENGNFKFFTKESENGEDTIVEVGASVVLNLENLIKSYNAANIQNINIARKYTIDFFKTACYILAFFSALIVLTDIYFKLAHETNILTFERLSALGIMVILILLPSLQKIKILGIEIEKISPQNSNVQEERNKGINNNRKSPMNSN